MARSHVLPGFLREAEGRCPGDAEAPIEYQDSILDQGCRLDMVELAIGIEGVGAELEPAREYPR